MTKMKLGTTALNVTYTDDELREKILGYVDSRTEGVGFRDICTYVLTKARPEKNMNGNSCRILTCLESTGLSGSLYGSMCW